MKVLRALRPIAKEEVDEYFVRGQYQAGEIDGVSVPAYTDEDNVALTQIQKRLFQASS